jgi:hypothetical protein
MAEFSDESTIREISEEKLHQHDQSGYLSKILMADIKCEICGALNRRLSSYIYDAEYS